MNDVIERSSGGAASLGLDGGDDRLAGSPLFDGLGRREREAVLSGFEERRYARGHAVALEHFRGSDFYVIADGEAEVSIDGRPVARLGVGDFFGEVGVLGGGPRAATVSAIGPLRCLVLDGSALQDLLLEHPQVGVNLLREVVLRFGVTMRQRPVSMRLATQ